MAGNQMLAGKFKIVFVVILIGLVSLTTDAAMELMVLGQGSIGDSLQVLIPKYKLYSRMVLLLAIIALGGFVYTYFDYVSLKERNEGKRFQDSIFSSIQDGLCVLDPDFNILRVNPTMEKWHAHALPLVGKKCYEAFQGRSEPCEVCASRRTLETGEAAVEIVPKIGANSKTVGWLELYSFPLLDLDTGKIKGVIEYLRDITARKEAEESLQKEKDFIDALFQTVGALVVVCDPQGRIVRFNQAFKETTGYPLDEVRGRYYWDIFAMPEDLEKAKTRFRNLITSSLPVTAQKCLVTKGGEHRLIAWSDTNLLNKEGKLEYLISTGIDITARKKTEDLLRESEKRYKMLFDSAPDAILIMEAEGENAGRIVAANQAAAAMHGYTVPEILDLNIAALNPRAKAASESGRLSRILAGEWIQEEITHLRKDGAAFPVEIHAGLMELEDHKYILAFDRDISERKRGEEILRETHQTLQALIQAAPLAIHVMNPEGKIQMWNPAAERLFGWKEEEVLGRPLPTIPKDKVEEAKRLFKKVLTGESLHGLELQRCKKDGSLIDVSVFTAPLYDAHGQITGFMSLNMDITESKRLKEQLLQSQKMEVVGRLAGGLAHDFNNLLTAITGYSELVLNFMDEDNPLRQDVAEIRKAGDRAASLTRQLLAFSRKQVLQPKVLDLNKTVESMGKMLKRLLPADIDLVISPDPNLGRVMADPGQIEQVIMNLAINARDAMPQGGRLSIETTNVDLEEFQARRLMEVASGPYVMLAVSDTGCGMDPETRSHIFEPFFTTKEIGKGTGLGLSMVYGIVKQSGGHISVRSQPGKGATFKIYLPRISGALEPAAPQIFQESTAKYRGQETILLVEDEAGVRQLVSTVLQRHGFTVLEASHGGDALDLSAKHQGPIHLVLTDMAMPGMGGQELAQRLKPLHPDLKILFLTGYAEHPDQLQDLPNQEIYYLEKPFEAHGLLQRVRELLDAPA
ncbi:MAG: PAS domain S-box protein [Deltaproteobacteria bacterium]|nr:PAS domain S-box protein [Deltaproteobacteria bacterium]